MKEQGKPLARVIKKGDFWHVALGNGDFEFGGYISEKEAQLLADDIDAAVDSWKSQAVEEARREAIEESLRFYEKCFEQNWTVQDTMDAIRALAGQEGGDGNEKSRISR